MIAAIVAATSLVTVALLSLAALVMRPLVFSVPWRIWVCLGVVLDALAIYGIFERRAPVWGPIISRGRPRTPAIAITFDDGPTEPYTSQILDVLRLFNVKATFFVLGARAETAPDVLR